MSNASSHKGPRATPAAGHGTHGGHRPYVRLALMTVLMFAVMYALMYAMVDVLANVFHSVNQVYMAGLMTAPMVALELWLMRPMYPDRRRNALVLGASVVAGLACWFAIRTQTGVTDRQFLRSMIPHHAGAVLMCEATALEDPRLRDLCGEIVAGQRAEIAEMKALLAGR